MWDHSHQESSCAIEIDLTEFGVLQLDQRADHVSRGRKGWDDTVVSY